MSLNVTDPDIFSFIEEEKKRQKEGIELIPSENYVSEAVMQASGSVLTNKYSEGYAGKRYYGGNSNIDKVEKTAIERAKALFGVEYANVQPYSGSPANFAVYTALLNPGDTITGLSLTDGGHLTHGWPVSATGKYFKSIPYHVKANGDFDFEELVKIAREEKPKLIWVGASAYPKIIPFEKFAEIADEIGAYLAADIAHIAGLIVTGNHPSPVPYAHIITTTTHKTLRGPRGAMIMVTKKGLEKDPEITDKIDKAVFPGLQGGPHNNTTAAIAVALKEAATEEFHVYGKNIVTNCRALAQELLANGITLVGGGTENHLLLIDTSALGSLGAQLEFALDQINITVNKNTIPQEPSSPFYPSGIRLGTPAITSRGMGETEMKQIARWIASVIDHIKEYRIPVEKEARKQFMFDFKEKMRGDEFLKTLQQEVISLASRFPVPGVD